MSFSVHAAVLPRLGINLHEALSVDFPQGGDVRDCIRADIELVNDIVQEVSMLTQSNEIYHAIFADDNMIYRVSCNRGPMEDVLISLWHTAFDRLRLLVYYVEQSQHVCLSFCNLTPI
jgi:hypothetical protein